MKQNKYTYYKIIQQHWGHGWEDVDAHETDSAGYMNQAARDAFKFNLKAYRTEQTAPVRVVFRRELNS